MPVPPLNHVLCIDDDADMRLVAELALEKVGGIQATTCASGEEALALLEKEGVDPDLILLDVVMPGMDGPATLGALQQHSPTADTPVIFLTARVEPRHTELLLDLGVLGIIKKPFDPLTLADEVLGYWERYHYCEK